MAVEHQNFRLYSGESKILRVTVTDESNAFVNLTNMTLEWVLDDGTGTPVLTKTETSGITVTDALNGKFEVILTSENTKTLNGVYIHYATLTDQNSNSSVLLRGTVKIK